MTRFCNDCGVKHLLQDCPADPDKKGNVTLNFIEMIPPSNTPNSSESNIVVPLKAITRAQAQANTNKGKRKLDEENETEATPSEHT